MPKPYSQTPCDAALMSPYAATLRCVLRGLHLRHQDSSGATWSILDDGLPSTPTYPADYRAPDPDPVDHPAHYTSHPSGVECITVTEAFNFNIGNAIKYLWRAGLKTDDASQDLAKAAWYVAREIKRLQG